MAAPLVDFDDEWQDLIEFKTGSDPAILKSHKPTIKNEEDNVSEVLGDISELHRLSDEIGAFKSMEDLVNAFDEKLSMCFHNNINNDVVVPVDVITESTLLETDEIWIALTNNYGHVMPIDWKESHTRSLYLPRLSQEHKPRASDVTGEPLDDEELREQLDMHTIIVSCLREEPLVTAEQVIEEIEEMMQDSSDTEAEQTHSALGISGSTSHNDEERVKALSLSELNERLEEIETTISRFSEELIQHLALRDELDFEKEVKNSFISILIDVQNGQKEQRELMKKKRKSRSGADSYRGRAEKTQAAASRFSMEGLSSVLHNGFQQTFGSGCSERQYLTTVIPYKKKGGPPSLEELQILTKILQAMRDNSDIVPCLLTDYILKACDNSGWRVCSISGEESVIIYRRCEVPALEVKQASVFRLRCGREDNRQTQTKRQLSAKSLAMYGSNVDINLKKTTVTDDMPPEIQ